MPTSYILALAALVGHGLCHAPSLGLKTFISDTTDASSNVPFVTDVEVQPLVPYVFEPLPLGSITPNGWLSDQLNLMANGLAGHLRDFYYTVNNSSWTGGGSEYSVLNEALPYWFNGLVPLAYTTGNPRLKAQVHQVAGYVLDNQWPDGWIGPETPAFRMMWARYLVCMGLTNLADANETWTEPVVDAMHRFVELQNVMLRNHSQGLVYTAGLNDPKMDGAFWWGRTRYQEMILSLQWLYEKYPRDNSKILLENMNHLYHQGSKWEAYYNKATYLFGDVWKVDVKTMNHDFKWLHGVNVGEGFKAAAVTRRFTHNDSLIQTSMNGVNWTYTYHGSPAGTVLGDEREDGLQPYTGSETCAVVEQIFSLSYLYNALGASYYADRAELTAFNALPASVTSDWWAHLYVQASNQGCATNLTETPFQDVQAWGQTFGLEPNYPCCTVNHPQGYPKFTQGVYVRSGSNGLAHALLSPASVTTQLSSGSLHIDCTTNYPFGLTLTYNIVAEGTFDFYVRVPSWNVAGQSSIHVQGSRKQTLSPDTQSGLHHLTIPAGTTQVTYTLGANIAFENHANDTVSVRYGALLYALEVTAENTSSTARQSWDNQLYPANYAPAKSRDYVISNTSAWAVAIDPNTLKVHIRDGYQTMQLANPIFDYDAPPIWMTASACEIAWPLWMNSVPGFPPTGDARKCLGKTYKAKLVPYGSSRLHMAELPTLSLT